jgi:hypothetical protein
MNGHGPPCQAHAIYHTVHVLGIGETVEVDIRLIVWIGAAQGQPAARVWTLEPWERG